MRNGLQSGKYHIQRKNGNCMAISVMMFAGRQTDHRVSASEQD